MERPFLTIGIASYNYGSYLLRAFEAIKRQKFTDFEVLYSDDGSTDDSVQIIKKIIAENPTMDIRLVEGKNAGVMGNKNRILDNALGAYVMLCDADDWMEDNCLELLCGTAIKEKADQVAGMFQKVDEQGSILQIPAMPPHATKWIWGVHHATIYNMDIIRKYHLRMEKDHYPDDVHFNTIFHRYSGETVFIRKVVYNWYQHKGSASRYLKTTSIGEDRWHGAYMLRSLLPCFVEAYRDEKDALERNKIEYGAIKMYVHSIYSRHVGVPFKQFWTGYRQSKQVMKENFPHYQKNPAACTPDGKGYLRKAIANIVYGTILLEKLHLFGPALWVYWCVAHKNRNLINSKALS